MRFKRAKKTKKNMSIYTHSFSFREPYQVLLDGTFLQVARMAEKDLDALLPAFLGGKVNLMTTYCAYAELRKLGPDFRITAARAKKLEKRRCTHTPAKTALECLKEIIGSDNKHHYCIASQDPALREYFRKIPGVPLIYINKSVLLLEPASKETLDFVNKNEIKKTGLCEFEKKLSNPNGPESETEPRVVKRKKKEPNPLSVKTSKKVTKKGGVNGLGIGAEDSSHDKDLTQSREKKRLVEAAVQQGPKRKRRKRNAPNESI